MTRILTVRRIKGRVVRVIFDDGFIADIQLPTKPTRLRVTHDGYGLKWGGPMQESSARNVRAMPRHATWRVL